MVNPVEAQRWARYTAETFSSPSEFPTLEEYLQAVSECLFEVCDLTGFDRPDLREARWVRG